MFIRWERKLLVHYPLVDDEHRMLLWLCRKVQLAVTSDLSDVAIRCACIELEAYTQFHLTSEENLMHEVAYPEVQQHSKIHAQLLVGLRRMTEDIRGHRVSEKTLAEFISSWLLNHIVHYDRKLANFLVASEKRPIAEQYYRQFLDEDPNI
jgi:hemerythrin-like metal-binding protein